MSARGKARRRAFEILFEAEQRSLPTGEILALRRRNTEATYGEYTEQIIDGVISRQAEIDEYLTTYSQGWSLERMPSVDRVVLRVGAWELLFNDDVPDNVAVAEAVAMARELSTDDSPSFINGLLGRLQQLKPTLLA
ncbi:N utilization substance protein B [Tersicoccus solisilvae]|uniref:Transcription antitermination protein NusB n=1 Tax=Tersicoccus solisilvae TaxID=1882339 RepID=A0ABQ1NU05_9MICC|nr:transcription antitermination factor NusB [Tersicoccus solisilvae]GGC82668.1 N utilization substance protein B [Tersicoccus solisilvae]